MSTTIKSENVERGGATVAHNTAAGSPQSSAGGVAVKPADFAELDAAPQSGGSAALDNLLNVSVSVTAELGRATTSIGQLLKLNVGSIVELERLVSEPVELVAQGVRLARGEVVVVEDRFAIRIQEIVEPRKRT